LKPESKEWSRPISGGRVQCLICPHGCILIPGAVGRCGVRVAGVNRISNPYTFQLSVIRFDPVEKKPLFHFYPGRLVLSLGGVGCNLQCQWCQNYSISQCIPSDLHGLKSFSIPEILSVARSEPRSIGVAFTYNEPTVSLEFLLEVSRAFQQSGLICSMITNGFINQTPLGALCEVIDAFNVDLKGFNENFYRDCTTGHLSTILQSLRMIRTAGKHLEVTFLAIPELNTSFSDFEAMCRWIADNLGADTPLHISRYHPAWQCGIQATPSDLLVALYEKAKINLNYVYLGNLSSNDYESTNCPDCGMLLVERAGYQVIIRGMEQNRCSSCRRIIPGVF